MDGQCSTYGESKAPLLLRPWLAVQLVCVVLTCASLLSGQWVNVSASYSIGGDGTLYATGVADASEMEEHTANATVFIWTPKNRQAIGSASVDYGGYAVANTSLAFDGTDCGEYNIAANGGGT